MTQVPRSDPSADPQNIDSRGVLVGLRASAPLPSGHLSAADGHAPSLGVSSGQGRPLDVCSHLFVGAVLLGDESSGSDAGACGDGCLGVGSGGGPGTRRLLAEDSADAEGDKLSISAAPGVGSGGGPGGEAGPGAEGGCTVGGGIAVVETIADQSAVWAGGGRGGLLGSSSPFAGSICLRRARRCAPAQWAARCGRSRRCARARWAVRAPLAGQSSTWLVGLSGDEEADTPTHTHI